MKIARGYVLIILLIIALISANAQSYHAFNGSAYAGGLGNFTNPASAVNSVFKWDISVLGFQTNFSNNALSITNLSVANLTPDNVSKIIIQPTNGYGVRNFTNLSDLHLLNIRFNIGDNQCMSYGLRLRSNSFMEAAPFSYIDTISGFNGFIHYNNIKQRASPFYFHGYNETWLENDFSYSRVLSDDDEHRFTGGITIALIRGFSGSYAGIDNLNYTASDNKNTITSGEATLLYSANNGKLDSKYTALKNYKALIKASKLRLGASFGFEYLIKEQVFEEKYTPKNYSWKFGASLMDIGSNKFDTDTSSVMVTSPDNGLTDTSLQNQFHINKNDNNFKNVLLANFMAKRIFERTYKMSLPTRLVFSVDKKITDNIFVNALISINFFSNDVSDIYNIKTTELNRLIITPRWETAAWGVYLPILYTPKHEMMLGLAIKAGPLVVGLHNVNWLQRSKLEELDGGGYLALHFQPFSIVRQHHSLDCFYN